MSILLRKPRKNEFDIYKKLEIEFFNHHKKYKTLLQDVNPKERNLKIEFANQLSQKAIFFKFIELNNQVVGYIYGIIKKADKNEKNWNKIGDLNSILILKKYRNKGLARFAVKEYFKWLKSNRTKYVQASCNVKNKEIIKFNKKLGFKEQHIKFGKVL